MRITVTHDDGREIDITEGVQVAYDAVLGSMDWGSGFLDDEECAAVLLLGQACGFDGVDYEIDKLWRAQVEKQVYRQLPYRKGYEKLQEMARERGEDWWGSATPTAEERIRMYEWLRETARHRTDEGS